MVELFRHQNTDTSSLGWLKSMESSTDMPNVMVGVGCGFGCLTSGEGFLFLGCLTGVVVLVNLSSIAIDRGTDESGLCDLALASCASFDIV